MKNLTITCPGLTGMKQEEMRLCNGGWILAAYGIAIVFAYYAGQAYAAWEDNNG